MGTKYKLDEMVPTQTIIDRLHELAKCVTKGPEALVREFDMRMPSEKDRDADLVLSEAARRLQETEWISVDDWLPTMGTDKLRSEDVLVFRAKYDDFFVGWLGNDGEWASGAWLTLDITHWMPIPKKP